MSFLLTIDNLEASVSVDILLPIIYLMLTFVVRDIVV